MVLQQGLHVTICHVEKPRASQVSPTATHPRCGRTVVFETSCKFLCAAFETSCKFLSVVLASCNFLSYVFETCCRFLSAVFETSCRFLSVVLASCNRLSVFLERSCNFLSVVIASCNFFCCLRSCKFLSAVFANCNFLSIVSCKLQLLVGGLGKMQVLVCCL